MILGAEMEAWFEQTEMGRYTAELERRFFARYDWFRKSGYAVRLGGWNMMPSESTGKGILNVPDDVRMNVVDTALAAESVDLLILPHTHESADAEKLFAEASRVLAPAGKVVLTGFNPHSLWCFSSWFDGRVLPERKYCLTLPGMKQVLAGAGFEIEYGQFMVYLPPLSSAEGIRFWQFMEKAGDRWWPQCAAVYGLVLVKKRVCVTPLPESECLPEGCMAVCGAARTEI